MTWNYIERICLSIASVYILIHTYGIILNSKELISLVELQKINENTDETFFDVFTTFNDTNKEQLFDIKLVELQKINENTDETFFDVFTTFNDTNKEQLFDIKFFDVMSFSLLFRLLICVQTILSSFSLIYFVLKKNCEKCIIFIYCEIFNIIFLLCNMLLLSMYFGTSSKEVIFDLIMTAAFAIPIRLLCVSVVLSYYKNGTKKTEWSSNLSKENTIY